MTTKRACWVFRRGTRGFTLIELLVVVVILGILMGLVSSVVQKARSAGRTAKCASNQRQLFIALGLFMGDNDGALPINYENTTNGVVTWDDQISGYDGRNLSSDQIRAGLLWATSSLPSSVYFYRCPEEHKNDTAGSRVLIRSYTMPRTGRGFAGTFRHESYLNLWPEGRFSSIAQPKQTILLCEVRGNQTRLGGVNGLVVDGPQVPVVGARQDQVGLGPMHGNSWNYLMCDGSVQRLSASNTIGTGTLSAPLGMWTRAEND
jgi:prepilin-type N-terminal cleavage/methylation domain-containing protein/prepilin-type processing-associated H-X9-DG protein